MAIAKRPAWLVDNPRPWGSRPSAFAWRPMLACAHLKVIAACAQPQRLQHPERGVELARTFDHAPLVVRESHRVVAILPRLLVQGHLCPLDLVRLEDSRAHSVAASPSAQRGHRCGWRDATNALLAWSRCPRKRRRGRGHGCGRRRGWRCWRGRLGPRRARSRNTLRG